MHRGEDVVETSGFTVNDVIPVLRREHGTIGFRLDGCACILRLPGKIFQDLMGFLK